MRHKIIKVVNSSLVVIVVSMSVSGSNGSEKILFNSHKPNEFQVDSIRIQNDRKFRVLEEKMKNYELVPKNKK